MILEKDPETDLVAKATATVRAMLANASPDAPMSFLEFCCALETALVILTEHGIFCLDFSLTFKDKQLEFEALAVRNERPDGFDLTDFRKTILAVCSPKQLVANEQALVVQRAVFSYQNDPTVQYRIQANAKSEPGKDG